MGTENLLSPLFFVIISLMAGAIMKYALKKSVIPYTVGLFCFGIIVGLLGRSGLLDDASILKTAIVDVVGAADPDVILYIFLPLLIFDAAYELNMHIFKKTLANASLLAVPGVIIAMGLTAALIIGISMFVPELSGWNWSYALMFGALISATDPVAVVALLKELGASKRFSTLVDAESMLNDGTGIVLFMLFFCAYSSTAPMFDQPVLEFCSVVAGGVAVGFVLARLTIWFITRVHGDALVQNSLVILSAYITFFVAQGYLEVSGVIALVAFGLTVTYSGKPRFKPEVNNFMEEFWELTAYIANTIIFIIVGIVIAVQIDFTWTNLAVLLGLYIGINLIRAFIILILYPIMKRLGYGLSKRESVILGWGGLRGALGLTLALMVSNALPIPEEIRKQILFYTAGIVTLTLTINATSTRWMLSKLGLTKIPSARILLDYSVRQRIRETSDEYLKKLHGLTSLEGADWEVVQEFLPEKEEKPATTMLTTDMISDIRLRILDKEKQLVRKLYAEGAISQNTFRRLTVSLDELYDFDGKKPLSYRKSILNYYKEPFYVVWLKRVPFIKSWIDQYFHEWVMNGYDLGRGFIITQKESIKVVKGFADSDVLDDEKKRNIALLSTEIAKNIKSIGQTLIMLKDEYPISYKYALTQKAIRMLLIHERKSIRHFVDDGLLSDKEGKHLIDGIDYRYGALKRFNINKLLHRLNPIKSATASK